MAVSHLNFEGIYDPKRMFAVTNWSDEPMTVNWKDDTGDNIYTLQPGEVRTFPQYLAYYFTKNFVDREMYKDAGKANKNPDGSPSKAQERLEMAVVNADMRKPYEDKTIQEIIPGKENPEITAMRAEVRKQLIIEGNLTSELNNNPDGSAKPEFPTVAKKKAKNETPQ